MKQRGKCKVCRAICVLFWSFDEFASRCLSYLVAGEEPDDEDEEGEDSNSNKVAGPKLPAGVPEQIGDVGELEAGDILNITLADLGLGKALVLF